MKFFTVYSPAPAVFTESGKESLTQQQFKDEADINVILKRFQEHPQPDLVSASGPRVPMWGDFSHIPDVREAHAIFQQAEISFGSLPADLRKQFNNNPVEMLAFIDSASPDQLRSVFGSKAPVKSPELVSKADSVSAVNQETIEKQPE